MRDTVLPADIWWSSERDDQHQPTSTHLQSATEIWQIIATARPRRLLGDSDIESKYFVFSCIPRATHGCLACNLGRPDTLSRS